MAVNIYRLSGKILYRQQTMAKKHRDVLCGFHIGFLTSHMSADNTPLHPTAESGG